MVDRQNTILDPGVISGCEVVGQVVKIGPNQNPRKPFKVGDRIAAGCHGGTKFGLTSDIPPITRLTFERSDYYPENGGFSEYVRMMTDLAWKIPDNISYEQAATVSAGVRSGATCMTHPKRLSVTELSGKISNEQWVSDGSLCSSQAVSAP